MVWLLSVACTGSSESAPTSGVVDEPTTTTTAAIAPELALVDNGDASYALTWDRLRSPAFFEYDDKTNPQDPFWHLHNDPEADGFFFSLEMFTTGYGDDWSGQKGEFEIGCNEAGSGICVHLNPDVAADPDADLNSNFNAAGKITIKQLDNSGYNLVLEDVTFPGGETLAGPTTLKG